ncbi:uncharacterized MFS-type transporter C09D4.1 [Tribolium castaneum]|uniref:Choline/ethanolamine transporter FLVCR1 n=1 Tax=Tribolium castaneum TaxID=7070 RepID=D7EID4_TRICA|nr:PREDICTED: uncharacterized MFS-type transporter C09D4.1 [Tribolium castaneum]EFA11809.1 putative MFS-type transporter C09D4.1-like Protein [Tribolium castaneum]|eukprot:XP_015837538.1 PREDICTED: uncharacterized MFS-type transporter C09D4.1 [Tribolium castaneum]
MTEDHNKDETNFNLLQDNQWKPNGHEIKAYKRRWIILTIFIIYGAVNSYQWIEYSIVNNIITRYYNVTPVMVDWTSIIYMALYAPLVIPASYILDKYGLRAAGLIGGLGTALGTSIKVFSIGRESFWIVLLGQAVVSASQLLILCLPPRIAAVWFKPNEVSTACSLGVFGNQLGVAIGFVLSPMIVQNRENVEEIGHDLKILCWGLTAVILPTAIAIIFYFPKQPPKPPSITQVEERNRTENFSTKSFFQSILVLLKNVPFVIHVVAFGVNIGVFSAVGTLLNQLVLRYFKHLPDAEAFTGRAGLVMIVVGMMGSILFGIFLDKTHKYKETTVFAYFMSSLSVVGFMFALEMKSKILVYIAIGVVGLFTNAYAPVGFEFAMELTYPSSEGTATGLLMAPSQVLGVVFALMLGQLNVLIGPFWSLASQVLLLIVGAIITCFVPNKLKRQEAFKRRINNDILLKEIKR